MYDAAASYGRSSAGIGFYLGVLACVLLTGYGAYVAFTDAPLPRASTPPGRGRPSGRKPSRGARLVSGGVLAAVGLCVLCIAWGQRAATRSSKMYASAYGASDLLSMF